MAPGIFDFLPPSVSEDPRRLGFIDFFNLKPYTNTNTNVNTNISENAHTNTNTNINTNPLVNWNIQAFGLFQVLQPKSVQDRNTNTNTNTNIYDFPSV